MSEKCMFESCVKKHGDKIYLVFRIIVGFLFFQHGVQKLFGWFGGSVVEIGSLIGAAGVIEIVVGLAVLLGLFTRLAALLGGLEMIVAYVMMHSPNGWNPLLNYGEPAVLYFAAFCVLHVYGAGKYLCFEKYILKKENF
ncbi:DoxX family protein [Candidatus Woesearchaeota archaeon CG10_big_fil_rev_8_21_14_0_10_34_8]|nr:MAG: DoxX family protein [Candidatus Woesearchaeota archaeon CG10_big_fil_rev_8_21_14_0_10_34_8]